MIFRYIISIILITISLIVLNYKIENKTDDLLVPKYIISNLESVYTNNNISIEELNNIISKLKAEKGVLIEEFKLKSNYDFISNKNYSIYIKRDIPENTKIISDYEKYNYNIFNFLEIDLKKYWEKSLDAPKPDLFEFSGVIIKNNKKKAYIYFKGILKEIIEGSNLGDYKVLKIFSNGVLLYNNYEKRFEVLR
ncbi:hypothetical protein JCM30566_09050 [Marinitoga arctica]